MAKVFAVDLGATNLRVALVDGRKVELLKKVPTPKEKLAEDFIKETTKVIRGYIDSNNIPPNIPLGMAVAGPVVDRNKKLVFLTEILGEFVSFIDVEKILGREIFLINDADAAVLAEREYGVEGENIAYLTISSGIGAGVIKNGKLLPGDKTEVGHFEITSRYEMQCECDGINHWEAFTSGKHISRFFNVWAEDKDIDRARYSSVYKIFDRIRNGDKTALEFAGEVHRVNAEGIALIDKKFNPEKIVLGGGVALNCQDIILKGLEEKLSKKVFQKISVTGLGDEISLLGVGVYLNKVL